MDGLKKLLKNRIVLSLVLCLSLAAVGLAVITPDYLRQRRIERVLPQVIASAETHRIDPHLVLAVIRQESDFHPGVRGNHGEVGLMQITEGAAADWARVNNRPKLEKNKLFNERLNLEIGTWYLSQAMHSFHEHPEQVVLALSQYNAGRSRALKWKKEYQENIISHIPFRSTRAYINNVVKYRKDFKKKGSISKDENQK